MFFYGLACVCMFLNRTVVIKASIVSIAVVRKNGDFRFSSRVDKQSLV